MLLVLGPHLMSGKAGLSLSTLAQINHMRELKIKYQACLAGPTLVLIQ
jgi:hypothetical protein